jgi:phenylacetate-coenzyme A ligase PaaK-like adenylate-forming protein
MPVIRYAPKDMGRIIGFEGMKQIIADHGVDLTKELADDGWTKPLFQWPFLVVLGRADYAVSIYGAKVSPQSIQGVFAADHRVRRFRLSLDDEGTYDVLRIDLELPEGTALSYDEERRMKERYSQTVLATLLDTNFDYADAYSIHADALVPRIHVHAEGTGPFTMQAGSFKPKSLG